MNPKTLIANWEVVSSIIHFGKFRDELQPKYENVKSSFILSSEYTYISLTKVKEIIRSCLKN